MESPYESPVAAIYYLSPYQNVEHYDQDQSPAHAQEAFNRIFPVFAKYSPAEPLDYKFVDEEYGSKFRVNRALVN